ncbi:HDOD domain-containing protein [Salinivibrio kushneri]|uniref:HDOD domain-containing protein n=1 Tax=Salinivibrio kushneri TaxID=1908198 RepID=UPI0022B43AD1|nr:HDOD domain-containing protein [Salinivibrio kushneri]WBA13325.1 HDOD domain-containing protein [Salinivibrio kushneri]
MTRPRFHIIYVDDDELTLKAIGREIRRLKPSWAISLIKDPTQWEKGLLEGQPPSLVISDLLMSKLKGDALLDQVRARFPGTIRALITGNTRQKITELATPSVHFVLPKPFSEDDFNNVLNSVERLHKLPIDAETRNRLVGIEDFPVLPDCVRHLRATINDPHSDMEQIARVVSEEPPLVARLLQLANSAYLGFRNRTWSLETAINRLGIQSVESIAATMVGHNAFKHLSTQEHYAVVDEHIELANVSKSLGLFLGYDKARAERLYLASVLSALGELMARELGCRDNGNNPICDLPVRFDTALVVSSYIIILWGYDYEFAEIVLASGAIPLSPDSERTKDGALLHYCRQWINANDIDKAKLLQSWSANIGAFFTQSYKETI